MKIVHLTSVHRPRDTRVFYRECAACAEAGHDISLIAKAPKDETVDGVKIIHLKEPKNRLQRMFGTVFDLYRKAVKERADIYHFHDPELVPIGMLLRLRGKRVIYDSHEDVPRQMLSKPWVKPWLRFFLSKFLSAMEWTAARFFLSGIVAATPTIAERFPERKTITVQNFPVLDELVADEPTPYLDRGPNIVYVGGLVIIRGVRECTRAMESVRDDRCRLTIAGTFEVKSEGLEEECRAMEGWKKVDFRGWQQREQVKAMLDNACAGLVVLHPTINYVDAYPVKMFEYMSASIPVIASDFPLWRQIVEDADCGMLVDPMDPEQIGNAINWILEHPDEAKQMGENGRRAVIEKYNWGVEKKKLLEFYKKVTGLQDQQNQNRNKETQSTV